MRTKVTLALVFLNVVLFFFIFKFERNWTTERRALETRKRVLGPEASDIRSLEFTGPDSYRLERRGETWWLTKPLEWPANPFAVKSIIADIQLLEHETLFSAAALAANKQSLADYGLDKPKLTLAFTSGEPGSPRATTPTTLRLGDTTKAGNVLYLLTDDQNVHVVRRTLADTLAQPLAQLRTSALFTIAAYEARALSIRTGNGGALVRVHLEGTRWTFDTPVIARASKLAVELAVT
ncbi:MAG: hypothetical protein RLZZ15_3492, partial [Verrucomicrobiota bacterium]